MVKTNKAYHSTGGGLDGRLLHREPRDIVAITVGAPDAGSTRFRLMQYLPFLESMGAKLEVIPQSQCDSGVIDRLRVADVVINQKCLLRRSLARQIVNASRYLIFDFDDAIYTRPGKGYGWWTRMRVMSRFKYWLQAAHLTTVANQELARAAQKYARQVEILPMAVDLHKWHPAPAQEERVFRIGWVGAPNNLRYLEALDPFLSKLLRKHPQLRLAVFCGKKPTMSCPFDYVPFTPDGEIAFIQQLQLGLLPLPDDVYSRGKSPIKAIQYLACGVPIVGDIQGAATEICTAENSIAVRGQEEWETAIESAMRDPARLQRMGKEGREQAKRCHDILRVAPRLWQLLTR